MRLNIVIGRKAGQGPNILTSLIAEALVGKGLQVLSTLTSEREFCQAK